jgi:hypothetical protein
VSYQSNGPDHPPGQPPPAAPGGYPPPPAAPGGYPPPPGGAYPPPAPPAKSGRSIVKVVLLVIIALVVVVVVVGVVAFVNRRSAPSSTAVGDCMVGQTAATLEKIDCSDAKVEWKVVGRVANKTKDETTVETTCTAWSDATVVYWQGKEGEKGFALCLAPVKK